MTRARTAKSARLNMRMGEDLERTVKKENAH
jgi:hypothetical protein